MKILLKNLSEHTIEKLIFNSLEQALYQAIAVIDGEERVIWESDKKVLLTRGISSMRKRFENMNIAKVVLRHESPYDEMVGHQARASSNRMEVPLRGFSADIPY